MPYRFFCRKILRDRQNPQINTWWQNKQYTSETNCFKHRYRKLPTSETLGSIFINFNSIYIHSEKVPQDCNMVSLDVKSLFISFPLDYTIDMIIRRIFGVLNIMTIFTKFEIKKLITLCTKNVHFSFNIEIYIQLDGVAIGLPLGPW